MPCQTTLTLDSIEFTQILLLLVVIKICLVFCNQNLKIFIDSNLIKFISTIIIVVLKSLIVISSKLPILILNGIIKHLLVLLITYIVDIVGSVSMLIGFKQIVVQRLTHQV